MPRAVSQRRVQHLLKYWQGLHPLRQRSGHSVMLLVAQAQSRQAAQYQPGIISTYPQAKPHVGIFEFEMQVMILRQNRSHQNIGTA